MKSGTTCRGDRSDASILVDVAWKKRAEGRLDEALIDLRCAVTLDSSPLNRVQLAQAEMEAKLWVEAEIHLEAGLAVPEDHWIKKHRGKIEENLRNVKSNLGDLELLGAPKGAQIAVDGKSVGTAPLSRPIRVTKGNHRVHVRADNCRAFASAVDVAAMRRTTLSATIDCPPTRRTVGWTMVPFAATALAIGVYYNIDRERLAEDFNLPGNGCGSSYPQKGGPECMEVHRSIQRADGATKIGYASAVVLGATAFYLLWPRSDGQDALACAPSGPGLICAAQF